MGIHPRQLMHRSQAQNLTVAAGDHLGVCSENSVMAQGFHANARVVPASVRFEIRRASPSFQLMLC